MKRSQHQDRIFADSEGDAWYRRNKAALEHVERPDALLDMVGQLPARRRDAIRSICDVGCSNGERLARFASALPHLERICGFDASAEAVSVGKAQFPEIDLRQGLAGEPPFAGPFDLVTISFVLHWVDRSLLAKTLAALDGLLADNGVLILSDFLPDRPCARRYHHRDDVSLFTFKQDYAQAFTGLGLYREIARTTFPHSEVGTGADASNDQERAVCAMLVRSLDYPEITA